MVKKRIWTKAQLEKMNALWQEHRIPQGVVNEIEKAIQILDQFYGVDRNVDDDGGYVLLILSEDGGEIRKEYHEFLNRYNLEEDMVEFKDVLCKDRDIEWHLDLFLVCNDYGVTIVYPVKRGECRL